MSTPPTTLESGQNIELEAVAPVAQAEETPAPPADPPAEPAAPVETEAEKARKAEEAAFAPKFAALSRKEKQLRDEKRALEAERAKFKAEQEQREKEYKEKYIDAAVLKDRRAVLKLLEEKGVPFKELAEMVLNGGEPTADQLTSDVEKKLRGEMEAIKKRLEEKEAKEQEEKMAQTIHGFKQELNAFIEKDPEYELIRAQDAQDLVFEVIETHYKNTEAETGTGVLLSNKEAADAVEKFLLEDAKKLVDREKVKKLMQPPPAPPKTPGQKAAPTLSNTQSTQVPTQGTKKLSDEESKREAAKLIKWID